MIKNDRCQRPRLALIRRRWQLVTLELPRTPLRRSSQKAASLGGWTKMRLPRGIGYLVSPTRRHEPGTGGVVTYLRCTIGRWNIDLDSEEGREAFRQIETEGVRIFRNQPGFVHYRLMVSDPKTTVAVAEWESEDLG